MKNFVLLFFTVLFFHSQLFAQPEVGTKAPDIILPNTMGETLKLSDLRGKVVLLDFWASWCGPCRHSNQAMKSVYKKYKEQGFEIFAVSIDDRKNAWLNAIRQDKITWPQVIDTKATAGGSMLNVWKVRYIPNTFLIDKEGKIIAVDPGKDELVSILKKVL